MSEENVFEVQEACSEVGMCSLPVGHTEEHEHYLTTTWCKKKHPAGVWCNRPKGHTGLCVHTYGPMAVSFSWTGDTTKEERAAWRRRAELMGVRQLYDEY